MEGWLLADDDVIISWVDDNYDPVDESPTEFMDRLTFRGKRRDVAYDRVVELWGEANPPPEVEGEDGVFMD